MACDRFIIGFMGMRKAHFTFVSIIPPQKKELGLSSCLFTPFVAENYHKLTKSDKKRHCFCLKWAHFSPILHTAHSGAARGAIAFKGLIGLYREVVMNPGSN